MAILDFLKKMFRGAALLLPCLTASVVLFHSAPSYAFNIPDTGQSKCYNSSGAEISCAGTGQDGAYALNPMSYSDNGNGTVTDNVTGLMWQKQDDGTQRTWADAGPYCDALTLGDYSDWRLPSKKELISIVNYSVPYPGPTINPSYFTGANEYWAAAHDISFAWYVSFYSGGVSLYGKTQNAYVRCVRGAGYPSPSFTDNGDGTVTDNVTGLMWQQQDDGTKKTWSDALTYCEGLSLADLSDWRLPDIRELESVAKDTENSAAIDAAYFPTTKAVNYWSSTLKAGYTVNAWAVPFDVGGVYDDAVANPAYVRCTRGGQSSPGVNSFVLTISKSGAGSGSVTADSGTLVWADNSGTASYNSGTTVVLTATADSSSSFDGWSGCDSTSGSTCTVAMNADKSVTATFNQNPAPAVQYTMTVNKSGTGSGSITADTGPISWADNTGTATYGDKTSVILTAAASKGSTFESWSGCDSTNGSQCTVTMNAARTVTATFSIIPNQYSLSVTKTGEGSGTVTSSPVGIKCGDSCSKSFKKNLRVTLRAKPSSDSKFTGWSGACSGNKATCTFKVDGQKEATANFDIIPTYDLTVTKDGDGSGTVTGLPKGLNKGIICGDKCSDSYLLKDVNKPVKVILKAKAASGSQFTGWSGACSGTAGTAGTGSCVVEMDDDIEVTATFEAKDVVYSGKTDSAGRVTVRLGTRSVPLVVRDANGDLIKGAYVGAALEKGSSSSATVVIVDPSGRYPMKLFLITGEDASASSIKSAKQGSRLSVEVPVPSAQTAEGLKSAMSGVSREMKSGLMGVATQKPTGKMCQAAGEALQEMALKLPCSDLAFCLQVSMSSEELTTMSAYLKDLSSIGKDYLLSSYLPEDMQKILELNSPGLSLLKSGTGAAISSILFSSVETANQFASAGANSIYGVMGYQNVKRTELSVTLKGLPFGDLTLTWVCSEPAGEPETTFGWPNPEPYPLDVKSGGMSILPPEGCKADLISGSVLGLGLSFDCDETMNVPPGTYLAVVNSPGYTNSTAVGSTDDAEVVIDLEGDGTGPSACAFTYSDWSACQADGTQTRTVISSSPADCVGTPVLSQSCTYVPPSGDTSPYKGYISGNWSGTCTFTGDASGTFSMTVSTSGALSGSYSGTFSGDLSGSVAENGSFVSGGTGQGAGWSGTFSVSGTSLGGSGSWSDTWSTSSCSGTWSGSGVVQ